MTTPPLLTFQASSTTTSEPSGLYEILVPTQRNSGKPFRTRHHKEWDKRVRRIAGGLTIFTPAKGQWTSPMGELFHDRMIPVRIACSRKQLDEIIQITLKHYDQLAVMAYKISDEVFIVLRESEKSSV